MRGGYWQPVFNILEGHCTVILVNAQHDQTVPERKIDAKDWAWLLARGSLSRAAGVRKGRHWP
jgi:hypothetical protein